MEAGFLYGGTQESDRMYRQYSQRFSYYNAMRRTVPRVIGAAGAAAAAIAMGGLRGSSSMFSQVTGGVALGPKPRGKRQRGNNSRNSTSSSSSGGNRNKRKFAVDQNQKTTYGSSNANIHRKAGANYIVFDQDGPWNPFIKDFRSLIYKIVNPRIQVNWSDAATGEVVAITGPDKKVQFRTIMNFTQLKAFKLALSNATTATTGAGPQLGAINMNPTNTITSWIGAGVGDPRGNIKYLNQSEFTIVQHQVKNLLKNTSTANVNIQIYDFRCSRDSQQNLDPLQLYNRFLAAQTAQDSTVLLAVQNALGIDHIVNLQNDDVKSMNSFAKAIKYIGTWWRLLKRTTIILEPGGIFEYVTTSRNVKLTNATETVLSDASIANIKGITRSLLITFEGQMVSGPTGQQNVITHGSGQVIWETYQNITLQNCAAVSNSQMLGYNTTRNAYFKRLGTQDQIFPNIDASTNVVFNPNSL